MDIDKILIDFSRNWNLPIDEVILLSEFCEYLKASQGQKEESEEYCKCYFADVPMSLDTDGKCEHCRKYPLR